MEIFKWLIVIILGYALGGFNGALIISKLLMKDDVRSHGSGNAGLTNFFRTYGGIKTVLVIVIDVLKCVLACLVAKWLLPEYGAGAQMVAGAAAVLGHSYPAVSQFRGGKGILCGAALAAIIDWRVFLIIFVIFVVTVALTRYISLGSILACVGFAVCFTAFHWGDWLTCIVAVGIAAFAIWRHHANIDRLRKGTESKFSFHKKK